MASPPKIGLSLCAGGGGLDMGVEFASPGFATACYVEWEQYPRESLVAAQEQGRFGAAPIWGDVKTFSGGPWSGVVDTILAGYPCQPFSNAGKRNGADDPRHLWPDIARIIREVQPAWVILENVAGHVTLGAETVLRELLEMGFNVAAELFTAAEIGSTQKRERWFCVAHASPAGLQGRAGRGDALTALPLDQPATGRGGIGIFPPGPAENDAWADVIRRAPDRAPAVAIRDVVSFARHQAQMVASGELEQAAAECAVRRMVDGMAGRSCAIKLLGNGVVPLEAAYAIRTLLDAHGVRRVDLGPG